MSKYNYGIAITEIPQKLYSIFMDLNNEASGNQWLMYERCSDV